VAAVYAIAAYYSETSAGHMLGLHKVLIASIIVPGL
jgi:hypothetical protein